MLITGNTQILILGTTGILNYWLGSRMKCFCWERVPSSNAIVAFRLRKEIFWLKVTEKYFAAPEKSEVGTHDLIKAELNPRGEDLGYSLHKQLKQTCLPRPLSAASLVLKRKTSAEQLRLLFLLLGN